MYKRVDLSTLLILLLLHHHPHHASSSFSSSSYFSFQLSIFKSASTGPSEGRPVTSPFQLLLSSSPSSWLFCAPTIWIFLFPIFVCLPFYIFSVCVRACVSVVYESFFITFSLGFSLPLSLNFFFFSLFFINVFFSWRVFDDRFATFPISIGYFKGKFGPAVWWILYPRLALPSCVFDELL